MTRFTATLFAAISSFFGATASLASQTYTLEGGFCNDSAFTIIKKSIIPNKKEPDYDFFEFEKQCVVTSRSKKAADEDNQPFSFQCSKNGATPLSGAKYRYKNKLIIPSGSDDAVDTRVYVYQCVESCSNAIREIKYLIHDCG